MSVLRSKLQSRGAIRISSIDVGAMLSPEVPQHKHVPVLRCDHYRSGAIAKCLTYVSAKILEETLNHFEEPQLSSDKQG
jgi:hypothetical protein